MSMRKLSMIFAATLLAAAASGAPVITELPTDQKPAWYEVKSSAEGGPSAPIPVLSARSSQPVALIAPGARFVAFGANDKFVTLAAGGVIGYVPRTHVSLVYTEPDFVPLQWINSSETLEMRLAKEMERQKKMREDKVSLYPSFRTTPPTAEELQAQQARSGSMSQFITEGPGGMPGQGGGYI